MSSGVKKFSFPSLMFFAISCIVGAGVFLSTSKAYGVGSYHVIWIVVIGAILALVLALAFAEMGGRFDKTGGVYLYAKESFGSGIAFNIGFIRFVVIALSLATEAVAIPALLSDFSPVFQATPWVMVLAILFLGVLFYINLRGISSSARSAQIIEIIVIGTIVTFIVTGLFHINGANLTTSTLKSAEGVVGEGTFTIAIFAQTLILLFYSFLGFENIGTGAQDVENPTKNIPRVIKVTLLFLALMYFFVYFTLVGVLGPELLNVKNGIGGAAASYMGPLAQIVVTVVCIIAICGIGLSQVFAGARTLAPMAEDRFFPKSIASTNAQGIPVRSLVFVVVLAFVFVILGQIMTADAFKFLISATTIGRLLQYIVVSLGVLRLRKTKGLSSGYNLSYAPILVTIAILVCVFVIIMAEQAALISITGLIIFTLALYMFYSGPRARKDQ